MNETAKKDDGGFGYQGIVLCLLFLLSSIGYKVWIFVRVRPWTTAGFAVAVLAIGLCFLIPFLWNKHCDAKYLEGVTAPDETAVLLGEDEKDNLVFLKERFRTMHAQVIGTTSAGKTESVILPWAIHDIEKGNGLLMIDGKSDRAFLDKLYAYVVKANKQDKFKLFSLAEIGASSTFNPLFGGSAREVSERVFSSFTFENEYYRNVQYKIFFLIVSLIQEAGKVPTFTLVHSLLSDPEQLQIWILKSKNPTTVFALDKFLKLSKKDRDEQVSGLEAALSHFTGGEMASLYNSIQPDILMEEVLSKGQICYFQLPTLYFPFLSEVTGKLVLQTFQSAVARRHLGKDKEKKFFSCYLDDFQDYIYPGFGALLNKSRSANVGVVFSHQSLGDLEKVSPAFRNIVLTNTNIKCVMRTSDPETSDYFSQSFGTETGKKSTERETRTLFGKSKTGEGSVRDVEQFKVHPNDIRALGTGQGYVSIPHPRGIKTLKVYFKRREDLPAVALPEPKKSQEQASLGEKVSQDVA